uniref:PDZ domain-containing protein n=1 Tax=Hanusia phi TaxID=3032 RepID=A0A7S0H9J4_9CRYP
MESPTENSWWWSRAASKISSAADAMSAKTVRLWDFHSGATDVICVRHQLDNGTFAYKCTDFHVHAARDTKSFLSDESVDVFVNGKTTALTMAVKEDHNCAFVDGSLKINSEQLAKLDLHPGLNDISFSVSSAPNTRFAAELFLWEPYKAIVICDIDGTLMRSDLLSFSASKLGFDAVHQGVCEALSALDAAGYQIVYLSARPISKASKMRDFLKRFVTADGEHRLPTGPLITTTDRTLQSLVKSLRSESEITNFKMHVLQDIVQVFTPSSSSSPEFMILSAGFGSKPADAQAYAAIGIPRNRIFIVDQNGRLSVRETRAVYESYGELLNEFPRLFPPAHIMMEKEAEVRRSMTMESSASDNDELDNVGVEQGQGASSPSLTFQITTNPVISHKVSPTDEIQPDSGDEGLKNDEDFDPDEWRRSEKKRLKERRIAEANAKWGFAPSASPEAPDAVRADPDDEEQGNEPRTTVSFQGSKNQEGVSSSAVALDQTKTRRENDESDLSDKLDHFNITNSDEADAGEEKSFPPEANVEANQSSVGLGLTFNKWDGSPGLVIKRIKADSAASKSDIAVGDRVMTIDNTVLVDIRKPKDLARLTHGRPGSRVSLKVVRQTTGEEDLIDLVRPSSETSKE